MPLIAEALQIKKFSARTNPKAQQIFNRKPPKEGQRARFEIAQREEGAEAVLVYLYEGGRRSPSWRDSVLCKLISVLQDRRLKARKGRLTDGIVLLVIVGRALSVWVGDHSWLQCLITSTPYRLTYIHQGTSDTCANL